MKIDRPSWGGEWRSRLGFCFCDQKVVSLNPKVARVSLHWALNPNFSGLPETCFCASQSWPSHACIHQHAFVKKLHRFADGGDLLKRQVFKVLSVSRRQVPAIWLGGAGCLWSQAGKTAHLSMSHKTEPLNVSGHGGVSEATLNSRTRSLCVLESLILLLHVFPFSCTLSLSHSLTHSLPPWKTLLPLCRQTSLPHTMLCTPHTSTYSQWLSHACL